MKYAVACTSTFFMFMAVLFYSVTVIAGYVFDHVHSYGGPVPMALDTAIMLSIVGVAGMILAAVLLSKKVHHDGA